MSLAGFLRGLFTRGGVTARPVYVAPGIRVRLRTPLASRERVWVPAGAAGIIVGWDTATRRASVELDMPRTVITVPWSWLEAEPPPTPSPSAPAAR